MHHTSITIHFLLRVWGAVYLSVLGLESFIETQMVPGAGRSAFFLRRLLQRLLAKSLQSQPGGPLPKTVQEPQCQLAFPRENEQDILVWDCFVL